MKTLLVSTYELGHQPIGLAAPAAALRARGFAVACLDIAVEVPRPALFADADLVAISVPMHTAARLGIELARRIRRLNPAAHIAFYGLYASTLYEVLTRRGLADSVIGGEYETGLLALAQRLTDGGDGATAGVGAQPLFERRAFALPDRDGLAALDGYAQLSIGGELRTAGYVEATHGCAHTCTHCPITPVYGGRLRLVQAETVLGDIDQQIEAGARHMTFGDPDFLNAAPHSLAIVEEMHRRHPDVTFDATIKVEHLIEHASLLPRLAGLGCLFITSAFESTDEEVLSILEKGHTRRDMDEALDKAAAAGIAVRPTWVAFTPWTTGEAFLDMLDFIERRGLVNNVQPVQYALNLLLPPGSPLIETARAAGRLREFDDETLTYAWTNPDARLAALQAEIAHIVEADAETPIEGRPTPYVETFAKVKAVSRRLLLGDEAAVTVAPQPPDEAPGLTEAWFCCAEPTTAQLAPLDAALRFGEPLPLLLD